tara:strand:+ start:24590 stop:26320 length:1731 start_codon:yes stop_codon:yes gene_type:complete
MCGYTYYINFKTDKNLKQKKIRQILNMQTHRGPDFSKHINIGKNHFFHNRLKVIDLSNRANQPMQDNEGNLIIFNGEIYNYQELIKKHNLKKLKTSSDTEVLLALYNKVGDSFVKELNGIFSFLIFNKKKHQIYIARDRFGVKPLFYYHDDNHIVFSTEIKPIISLIEGIKIDLQEIAEYISSGKYFHKKETFFRNINIFPASNFKVISLKENKVLKSKKYWILKENKKLICKNYSKFYRKFLDKFKTALKLNFVADVKLSLLLSSGNDSIFIHEFIKDKTNENLNCFTYGWKDIKYNEIKRLEKTNLKIRKHHKLIIKPQNIFSNLKNMVHKFEGPIGGFGTLAQYNLFKKIRKNKIKVAFSGEGADEFLLGYSNFDDLLNKKQNLKKKFQDDRIYSPDGYVLEDNELINKNFQRKKKVKYLNDINKIIKNYIFEVKLPKLLLFYDKASSLNGIEGRVPMLDFRLAEFLYSNSFFYRLRKKPIKDYLKTQAISFHKNKLNVSTPQREFFKKKDIPGKVLKIVKNGYLQRFKILNIKIFEKKYKNFLKEKKSSNSFFIWKVLNAEYFLQNYENYKG